MKRFRLIAVACVVLIAGAAAVASALDVPPLRARVNDYAGLMSATQRSAIEAKLAAFEQETSTQVVVLTIPSLEGDPLEDFSIRVVEKWKIGQADVDNGVLLLIARDERKIRIEVGYGLEGALTDLESKRIIDGAITPAFRAGDFGGGIAAGVDGIIQATKGEYTAPAGYRARTSGRAPRSRKQELVSTIFTILFFLVVVFTRVGRVFWPGFFLFGASRGGGRSGGGGFGGFGGGGGSFGGGGASGGW